MKKVLLLLAIVAVSFTLIVPASASGQISAKGSTPFAAQFTESSLGKKSDGNTLTAYPYGIITTPWKGEMPEKKEKVYMLPKAQLNMDFGPKTEIIFYR